MLTEAARLLLTLMAITLEAAGLPLMQPVPFPPIVINTDTLSLFARVLLENVALVAPVTLVPLICH
jgi:hypothetical protein